MDNLVLLDSPVKYDHIFTFVNDWNGPQIMATKFFCVLKLLIIEALQYYHIIFIIQYSNTLNDIKSRQTVDI